MASTIAGGGYEFSTESTGGTWSWKVEANNIQGAGQFYQIVQIETPYGPYERTQIPIPGDVIKEISSSLTQFEQQLAPLLALVDSSQTIFNLTITEGDPNSSAATIAVVNSGAFGSYMTATATSSVQWLQVSPVSLAGLGKNEQDNFGVLLIPSTLTSADSPYQGIVNLQDNRSIPTVIPITFNITVFPRPVILAAPTSLSFTYTLATHTGSGSQIVSIENAGPANSSLEFVLAKVHNTSDWLTFVPTSGGPLDSGDSTNITFGLVHSEIPQFAGVYTDTVRITSENASNSPVDISITLTVS